MRFRPRTWWLFSLLIFAASYWVWTYAEKISATRRAREVQPATARPTNPPLSKVAQAPAAAKPKSYIVRNTRLTEKQLLRSDHAIILRNALIDTDRPLKLDIPAHLRAKGAPGSYIVQSERPLDQRFMNRLARDGVKYVSYIPNNAALVQATPEQARQMASDAEFQAVLPYEPYYKLATSLLPSAVEQNQPLSQALNVTALPGQGEAALAALKALGAQLMGQETGPFGTTFSVMVPPEQLVAVAQLPLAQEIEPYAPRRMLNDLTRVTMGIATNSLYATPNYLNLTGLNVTVNMNDTGADSLHPDFKGPGGTLRLKGATAALTDQASGHGTHVAGIIMGNGSMSSNVTTVVPGETTGGNIGFQGKATNAELFVQTLGLVVGTTIDDAFQEGGTLISDASLQTNASVQLGPTNLISNNSWGYEGINGYDMHAASFDQATRDAQPANPGEQPLLFVVAAGGEGNGNVNGLGGLEGSIISPATAKNVITVGSLDASRFITNDVDIDGETNDEFFDWTDNDNLIAWFSSCGNINPGTEGIYGRFKPDVVAPGMFVISCRATNYTDPTNEVQITTYPFPNQLVLPGQVEYYSLGLSNDTEELIITVTPNADSPTPFPSLTILGDTFTPPTTVLSTSNYLVMTNQFTTGQEWYFGITNGQAHPVSYDLTFYQVETNDLGVPITNTLGYYSVISNLNSVLKPWYVYQYGTSQSAGAVSGMLALMQEFLQTQMTPPMTNPSPALLKAMLINGSRSAEQQYDFDSQPEAANEQGWGLPNLPNSLPSSLTTNASATNAISMLLINQSTNDALATGQSQTYEINCRDGNATNFPLRVTLVWTDPPGDPAAGIALVNNLDLVVTDSSKTNNIWLGNDFFSGDIFSEDNTGDLPDVINNVQNVYIDSGTTNTPSTPFQFPIYVTVLGMRVNVNAATTMTNLIAQDYALVISSDDRALTHPLTITSNTPTYTSPVNLANLAGPTFTNAAGAPLLAPPLLGFAEGNYGLVTFVSNAVPLLHQRVGANEPNLYTNGVLYTNAGFTSYTTPTGTNGNVYQWHFFVFSSSQFTNGQMTNLAFTTFEPPDLATQISPRTNGADLDMYVATNSDLTNLDANVIAQSVANGWASLSRGGTETVLFTNASTNENYYIGIKSEDQQGADFGFYAVAQSNAFSTLNPNGSVTANGTGLPVPIPDSLLGPPAIDFAFLFNPLNPRMLLREVTATLGISHANPSDLYGTLQHNDIQDVLNDYSGEPGGFTNSYNDLGDNTIPGSVNSDGPGSLKNFIGSSGQGMWMITESDNALLQAGEITTFSVTGSPQPLGLGFTVTIGAQQWFDDYVVVPNDATNIIISVSYLDGTGPVDIYITNVDDVGFNSYGVTGIVPPGGFLSYGTTNNPPLAGGPWYYGIFNDSQSTPVTLNVQISFQYQLVPNLVQTYTNNNVIPLTTDGTVSSSQFCIPASNNGQQLVDLSVGVRLNDPNLDDLVLQLTSPQGTSMVLFENRGGLLATNLGLTLVNTNSTNAATTNYVYTVFTEDPQATEPIKFASPPYAAPVVFALTNIYTNGFEDTNGLFTNGMTVDGWSVETNEVSVMTEPTVAYDGTNYLALASGRLSQTFATVVGASYELRYHARSPGLISWWPADGNTNDLIGTNNGVLVNGASYNAGEVGEAFSFDGDYQYVRIADSPSLRPASVTLECWFNVSNFVAAGNNADLISKPVGPGIPDSYAIWLALGNIYAAVGNATLQPNISNVFTPDFGVWYHTAFTYDTDSEIQTLYLNGVPVAAANAGIQIGYDTNSVLMGTDFDFNSPIIPLDGRIDESAIYNRALTAAEIYAIYHAGSAGKYSTNSLYPNFQVDLDGLSTNTVILTNFDATNWFTYTNSFIATTNDITIELAGNPLGVLLDDIQLVQLPYTNYNNYYLPEEPLTPLIGQNPQGCWTLSIWDTRMDSTLPANGELLSWTLQATTSSTNVSLIVLTNYPTPPSYTYSTNNLPASGGIIYFGVDVPATAHFATNTLVSAGGPMNLLFNQTALPTGTSAGDVTLLSLTGTGAGTAGTNTLSTQGSPPPLAPGQRYFLGVQNTSLAAESFSLEVQFDVSTNPIITPLTNGMSLDPTNAGNTSKYYSIVVPTNAVMATFQLTPTNGQAYLYAREGNVPTTNVFDYASLNEGISDQFIVISTNSQPVPLPSVNPTNIEPLSPQTWYLQVYNPGTNSVGYTILATFMTNCPTCPDGSPGTMDIINLNNYLTNSQYTYYVTNASPTNVYANGAPPGYPTNLLYAFTIPETSLGQVEFTVSNLSVLGNVQLLVNNGAFPTPDSFYIGSLNAGTSPQTVFIMTNDSLTNLSATWYLAVPNTSSTNVKYSITAIVTNGPLTQALTWDGGGGTNWNFTELDWRPASGAKDTTYNDTDLVNFDDSLTASPNINIPATVKPGSMTFSNSAVVYTFTGPGRIAGATGLDIVNGGLVVLDNSGGNTFSGLITNSSGTLQIGNGDTYGSITASITNNGGLVFNRTDNLTYAGNLSGNGIVLKQNANTLTLAGDNTSLYGTVQIKGGTLRLGAPNAIGSGTNATIEVLSLVASLDLNSISGTNLVTVRGTGATGNGAIVNNGFFPAVPGLAYMALTGHTTIGGSQRWDLGSLANGGAGPQTTNYSYLSTGGVAYNLTKVGFNAIGLVNCAVDPALANIDVQAGTLEYEGATTSLGNPADVLTIESGATLELVNAGNPLNKVILFQDGATDDNVAGVNTLSGPVILGTNALGGPGTVTFNIETASQSVNNTISGTGNLSMTGGQSLYLSAFNTYTGSTLVANGTIFLTNAGSIGLSSNVMISASGTIDATGRPDLTFKAPSGQTLQGFGNINGLLSVAAGATVAPGAANATGVLTVSSNVALAGTAFFEINNTPGGTNDVLESLAGSITYGGTLQISNLTTNVFTSGQSFQLFSAATNYAGAFTNIVPAMPATGLIWNTSLLASNGTLSVSIGSPVFTSFSISGTNLVFSGTNGIPGGTYVILASTNLTQAWTPLVTNTFPADGTFSVTEPYSPTNQQQFFTLQQPY